MSIISRRFRYDYYNGTVYWLIGINVLIFAVMRFLGMEWLTNYLAMIPGRILQGWIWTFATYMFVHGGMSHIFFNMLALFIFGVPVEQQMGSKEFLLFYFVTGILAGVFSFGVYYLSGSPVALVGASGAIFAVELAYAILFPHSVIYIWAIIPVRAPILVLGFTALALVSSIFGFNRSVAHFTHLAGFGFAWLYFLIRLGINPWTRLRGL